MPRSSVYRQQVELSAFGPRRALTAAARVYSDQGPGVQNLRKNGRKSRADGWQNDIWDFYDTVPEFRAACSWVGNLISKAVLEVHYRGKPTTDQDALDALASFFGGPEGQEEMLRLLGINFTATGEGWVIGYPGKEQDVWKVTAAIKVGGESLGRLTVDGDPVPAGTLPIRLWKEHPAEPNESDCPARALIPVLQESVRITQVVAAQADSRLKGNGILWVPSELEMPSIPVTTEDGDLSETSMQDVTTSQGITQQLIKIASVAMLNRDSAAAGVPLVIAAPGEYLEKVQWTDFWTGFDEHIQSLREDNVKRIGRGMDMPPEALTGTSEVNHWGAWAIEEAAIKIHTEPLLAIIVSSLSKGYLQPYMAAAGAADPEGYTFEANTAALRLRPNRSKEAVELYDRGELKGRTMLVENGFDPENDAPDEAERIMFFLSNLARKTSASPEQLTAVLDRLGIGGLPTGEGARGALETPSTAAHPVREVPDPEESEAEGAQASAALQPYVIDGLVLACEAHVYRALERAGNRLKNRVGPVRTADGRVKAPAAADLYLSMPDLSFAECEDLLEDAWPALERFAYPGVSTAGLRDALHEYALFLLRTHKPMTRESLARHLMMELAEAA